MAQDDDKAAIEVGGKSVDDAVQQALRRLGLSRSQVRVAVLQEGRTGVFGIGAASARVRVTPIGTGETAGDDDDAKPLPKIDDYAKYEEISRTPHHEDRAGAERRGGRTEGGGRGGGRGRARGRGERSGGGERSDGGGGARRPQLEANVPRRGEQPFELLADPEFEPEEDPIKHATNVLTDLLHLTGVEADVSAREPETPMDGLNHARAVLDVKPANRDDDLGILIGRRGEHLAALQYIVNLIVNRSMEGQHAFTVDVDGYKRRREETLNTLAQRMADRVRESGESFELEPMPPAERRIVHIALADDPDVATESVGQGDARRVEIVYRDDA